MEQEKLERKKERKKVTFTIWKRKKEQKKQTNKQSKMASWTKERCDNKKERREGKIVL